MKNRKAKRIIALLLCLAVFFGSELSGMTNIVGDLFAAETPTAEEEGDTLVTQKEEIEITGDLLSVPDQDSSGDETDDETSEEESDRSEEEQTPATEPSEDTNHLGSNENDGSSDDLTDNKTVEETLQDGDLAPSKPADTDTENATPSESSDEDADTENATPPESSDEDAEGATLPTVPDENIEDIPVLELPDEISEEDETEEDYSALMTLQELDDLPIEEVGATIQKAARLFRLAPMSEEIEEENQNNHWDFSVYYQNSEEENHVTLTGDSSVKYQMEFHTDVALAPGKVEIRIPYGLFRDRDGTLVIPSDIAVPQSPDNTDDESVYNKSTPFNYYITATDENGNPTEASELVFFNYRRIAAGTNAAWQILYKNLSIMQMVDGSKWGLQAEALVTKPEYQYDDETGKLVPVYEKDENGESVAAEREEKRRPAPLTGVVDSSVSLIQVTKRPYKEDGDKKYTPGLYTEAQIENYISGELPAKYAEQLDQWKFVVWEVTMEGSATQPWNLELSEALTVKGETAGEIVGYRNYTNSTYSYAISEGIEFERSDDSRTLEAKVAENQKRTYFRSRFYVVTAYPAGQVKEEDLLENKLTVKMKPVDGIDESETREAQASWNYENYDWTYAGDAIHIDKVSDTVPEYDQKDYDSWLEAYSKAMDAGEDYGNLWFSSTGSFQGYGSTHYVEDSTEGRIGEYIEGTGYELTTVDDFMYAAPSYVNSEESDMIMLDWEDYYYTSVKVTQTDYTYDFLEDQETQGQERPAEGVYLYAMYAKPDKEGAVWADGDIHTWVPVNGGEPISLDSSTSTAVYTFSPEELAREPWRVKAVHETTEYKTVCKIDVNVRLRAEPSDALQKIMEDYKKDEVSSVKLEDLSGVLGRTFAEKDRKKVYTICETDSEENYKPYNGLKEATLDLYENEYGNEGRTTPIQRDSASVTVYGLQKEADAFKTYRTTNDVANSRAMVDYYLTAYDGYKVHEKEAVNYLKSMGVPTPGKNHVMFYDLLPYGMYFDPSKPVFAGRITELDRNGYYKSRTNYWDDTQVELADTEVLENWNGTGRTMLIFHIDYNGADPAVYTDGKWLEGWGVSFRAYYEWKDMESVQKQYNISAFMPDVEKYEDPAVELLGEYSKVYKDGAIPFEDAYADFKVDGGLNSANTEGVPNVLYAKCQTREILATSSTATIEKLVRADSDIFSVYSDSAYAEEGEGYTYKITVETKNEAVTDLVIFDHLEHAAVERAGAAEDSNYSGFSADKDELWHGTFRSVQLSGLTAKGADPIVWYNTARNAATTQIRPADDSTEGMETREEEVSLEEVLTAENGWYQEEDFIVQYKATHPGETADKTDAQIRELAFATVRSIAVDLRKAAGDTDKSFTLEKNDSLSFLIRMKAPEKTGEEEPEDDNEKERYAYNNPSYYSRSVTNETGTTQTGDSVRVRLGKKYTLEVIKELEGDVPASLQGQSFTFQAYRMEKETGAQGEEANERKVPLSNKSYTIWTKTEGTKDEWTKLAGGPYAADADGYFRLQAGQKAVFENVSNAEDVVIEEAESIFWKTQDQTTTAESEEAGTIVCTHTVTNQYRYVLYVQKKIEGVPDEVTLSDAERTFEFQIKLGGEPWNEQELEYCRVDGVRLDGVSPGIIPFEDGEKVHTTEKDGTFEIQEGWILAFFLESSDMQYQLSELYENTDGQNNWIENRPVTGTVLPGGKSEVITNRYRWKDLYLTKKITHQEAEDCQEEFTFQLFRWEENMGGQAGGGWVPVTSGNEWMLVKTESDEEGTSAGDTVMDETNQSHADSGRLDEKGSFSALCAGRTIRIKNLEAGVKYQIKEIEIPENYEPGYLKDGAFVPSDTVEVTMPVYSESQRAEIVNDYLLRPLSVKKTVVSDEMTDDISFHMILAKGTEENYEVLSGQTYVIKETGESQSTGENGVFSLKAGQTAVFENLGQKEEAFVIWEIQENAKYPQIFPAGDGGTIDGRTVGAPVNAVLTDAGADAEFINGSPEFLLLSKEYEGGDETGEDQVESLKLQMAGWKQEVEDMMKHVDELKIKLENDTEADKQSIWDELYALRDEIERLITLRWSGSSDYDVRVSLEGEEGWSLESPDHSIICIDQLMGMTYELRYDPSEGWTIWYDDGIGGEERPEKRVVSGCDVEAVLAYQDGYFNLKPWMTYVIYMGESIPYTVSEENPYEYLPGMGYVISQKTPEPGGSLTGVTGETSTAVLCNEIKTFINTIQKKMTADSDPVPSGKELVWCVQRYDKTAKRWNAAEGVEYLVLEGDQDRIYDSAGSIQRTGKDGMIRLSRDNDQNTYLAVQFLGDERVLLNTELAEDKTLRVIEVPEESDPEWGVLAGYGTEAMKDRYGMDVSGDDAVIIYNSNQTIQVEIEKQTEKQVNETFTMFLKQMITDLTGLEGTGIYQPGQGIAYTIYDSATHQQDGSGISGVNGEIRMLDGQYVRLSLPSEAVWAVSEDQDAVPNFSLTDLEEENDSDGILTKEGENLMLIGRLREGTTSITQADVAKGVIDAGTGERVSLSEGNVVIPQYILQGNTKYEVTGIAHNAFGGCSDLETIRIPDSVTSIGSWAFEGCTGLNSVVIPNGVTRIEDGTFCGSGLTGVTIPESVTSIGRDAFSSCTNLIQAELPEHLQSIGSYAFAGSGLKEVYIPASVTGLENGVFAYCESLERAEIACDMEDLNVQIFWGCENLKEIQITGNVKRIGDGAFYGLTGLVQVTLPESLDEIGENAFRDCSSLESISIPEGVTVIGGAAFSGSGLVSVVIPEKVTCLGAAAFWNCAELERVTFQGQIESLDNGVFQDCSSLTDVLIEGRVTRIADGAFRSCSSLERFIVSDPGCVTAIGANAFYGLTALQEVQFAEGLESIGENAFFGCSGLKQIKLAEGLKSIGANAFYGCSGLKAIILPESTRAIGNDAFLKSGLEQVTIPEGVEELGAGAFYGCEDLKSVKISCSVEELDQVFNGCTALESVVITGNIGVIKWNSFSYLTELKTVEIQGSVKVIDAHCFEGCSSLEEIHLPSGLEEIRQYAFSDCEKLERVTYASGSNPNVAGSAFNNTPYKKNTTTP